MGTTYHNKPIVTDGLVFCIDPANKVSYPGSGTTVTDLINNITGTLQSSGMFETNDAGVFNFDGATNNINCGTNSILNIINSLSISVWFKTSSAGSNKAIVNRDPGYSNRVWQIGINNLNQIYIQVRGADTAQATSTTTYADGNWHNASAVYDPSTSVKLYIDGDLVHTNTVDVPASLNDIAGTPLYVGAYSNFNPEKFNGDISNILVYNKTLSASEVFQNYNALKNRFI